MATQEQIIRAALEEIATKHDGLLRPDDVVKAAKSPRSPLHDHFEWDDTRAGHLYRITQARDLIRGVVVRYTRNETVISTVAYVKDPRVESGTQGYAAITRLMSDRDAARAVIIREFQCAEAALQRARDIAHVLGAEGEVDELMLRARAFRESVERGVEVSPL